MRFLFIGQLDVKYALQAANELRLSDGKEDLNAMAQIASHQVGAAEINFFYPSVPKIVDPTMFQEPANNACDPDIFAEPIH